MPLIFSYDTLQRPDVQLSTFGRLLHGQRDALPQYELAAADSYGQPASHARRLVTLASGKQAWIYVHAG